MRGRSVSPPPQCEEGGGVGAGGKTYYELKGCSEAYQTAKYVMVERLEQSGWGRWVGKPLEEDFFCVGNPHEGDLPKTCDDDGQEEGE